MVINFVVWRTGSFLAIVEGDMDRSLEIFKMKFVIFFVWTLLKLAKYRTK